MSSLRRFVQLPMTRPSLLGAVLAVLVGAVTFVYLNGSSSDDTVASAAGERVSVLVAATSISARDRIGGAQVELRELPLEAVHPNALHSSDSAVGRFATTSIVAGEQILGDNVADAPRGGGLAQLIPAGSRGIAIPVSPAVTAGGNLVPGDRVDIVTIFEADEGSTDSTISVVAADVEVLAVSQNVLGDDSTDTALSGENPRSVSATVTIAVPLADAQRIALANQFGTMVLFLRNPDDDQTPFIAPIDLSSVKGS